MTENKIKTYITRDKKRNAVIAFCVVFFVFVIISILELVPGNITDPTQDDDMGVGRVQLFPFVFTDSDAALYVVNDTYTVLPIDDSVTQSIHDASKGNVYYLRNNQLFEYDISANTRKQLIDNCASFILFEDRSAIFTIGLDNSAYLYLYKGDKYVKLSEKSMSNILTDSLYCVGENGVLFADNSNAETGKMDLLYCNRNAKVIKIAENIDPGKSFYIDTSSEYVCYKKDGTLFFADLKGNVVAKNEGAQLVKNSSESYITEPINKKVQSNQSVAFKYLLSNIVSDEDGTTAGLMYFKNGKLLKVAEKISNVIYYSQKDDMILYTVQGENSSTIYMSSKGGKPQKQITCDKDATFLYQESLGLLYFRNEDATLNRYKVLDVSLKISKISDNTGFLYSYYNKKIMGYQKNDGSNDTYILFKKGDIERIDISNEIRLYGLDDDEYLLCRKYSENKLSLDLVINDRATRLCQNISKEVFFDANLDYILYSSNDKVFIWHEGDSKTIGDFTGITAVDIAA